MVAGYLRRLEQQLTFRPDTVTYHDISRLPLEYFEIEGTDGVIHGAAYLGAPNRPFVFLTHGNTGNITFPAWHYEFLIACNLNFFTYDYPGYGKSDGEPCERSLYESGLSVFKFAKQRFGFQANKLIYFGLSLGAAVSIELASQCGGGGMIMESPFTSARDMGRYIMPRLPLYFLVKEKFRNREKIGKLSMPILILHGRRDKTTPVYMSEQLVTCAKERAELYIVEDAGHTDIGRMGGEIYKEKIQRFIDTCIA